MQTHTLSMIVQHGIFHEEDIAILWSLLFIFFIMLLLLDITIQIKVITHGPLDVCAFVKNRGNTVMN